MNKFTAGPWANICDKHGTHEVIQCETASPICQLFKNGDKNHLNNARLIAAAPELLEALKETTEQLRTYLTGVEDGKDDEAERAYQFGRAAITKATEFD